MNRLFSFFAGRRRVRYWELFLIFLKVGSMAFGGGYVILPYIHNEIVVKRKWFRESQLVDIFTVSQALPGAIAVNAAFNIGYRKKGIWGGLFAATGIVLPAFVAILLILLFFIEIRTSSHISGFLRGVLTASAALILLTAIKIFRNVFKKITIDKIILAGATFIGVALLNVNALWFILTGIVYGLIRGYLLKKPIEEPIEKVKIDGGKK